MRAAFSRSGVGTTLAVVALALAVYVCSSLAVMQLTGDAVAGSAAGSAASLVSALVYRRWRHGSWAARRPDDLPSPAFWGWAAAAVAASFLAGQTLAVWVYGAFGSPGYDAVVSSEQASPAWLLLVTTPLPRMDWLCRVLETLGLSQKRTSPHDHLIHFRDLPLFAPVHTRVVLPTAQWGVFRSLRH